VPEVISNTSPLQYLHQTGCLGFLPSLYSEVIVPVGVVRELTVGRDLGTDLPIVEKLPWVRVRGVSNERLLPLAADLGQGEREVLALAAAAVRFLSIEPLLEDLGQIDLRGIDWVIVGGESGPGARPMERSWVVSIRRQCRRAKVPFFFKQWGGVRKSVTGRELDGRTYDEFPRIAEGAQPSRAERQERLLRAEALLREVA